MKAGLAKSRCKPQPAKEARGTLTKEAIVRAALDLIAKMLNVFPTAIYWHIEGRKRLLGDALALVRPRRGP